jgi:hypothetical protein
MLWLTIGVGMSRQLRRMNNQEVILWLNAIFYKKQYLQYRMYWSEKLNKTQNQKL